MNELNYFDMGDFKKWINKDSTFKMQKPDPKGLVVESKVDRKYFVRHISIQEGPAIEIVDDFMESGGTVVDVDGKNFLIEVASGTFYVPRNYVTKS